MLTLKPHFGLARYLTNGPSWIAKLTFHPILNIKLEHYKALLPIFKISRRNLYL